MRILKNKFAIIFSSAVVFILGSGSTLIKPDNIGNNTAKAYEIFYDLKNLHELELVFTQAEWNKLLAGYKANRFEDIYYKADLYYKGILGDTLIKNVGFRVRGNTSRRTPQLDNGDFQKAHFKIKFNECFDAPKGSDERTLLKKRKFARQEIINLKWVRENELYRPEGDAVDVSSDRTQIREMYSLSLLNKVGVNAPKAAPASVTISIDGKKHKFGIYYIVENIDKTFLKNRYRKEQNKGNLYKCMWGFYNASLEPIRDSAMIGKKARERDYFPPYDIRTNKKKADHSELYSFINNLNSLQGDSLKTYLYKNFEIDRYIRGMALTWLLGNPDDYRALAQNYYLYFNNAGKIDFILYDFDHCLGAEWNPGTESLGIYDTMDYPHEWDPYGSRNRPLVTKVLEIPEYKAAYEKYLKYFTNPDNGIYRYENFKKTFDTLYPIYKPHLENEMHQAEWMELDEVTRSVNPKNGGVRSVKYYYELKMNKLKQGLDKQ
jgi:spore coat protein H